MWTDSICSVRLRHIIVLLSAYLGLEECRACGDVVQRQQSFMVLAAVSPMRVQLYILTKLLRREDFCAAISYLTYREMKAEHPTKASNGKSIRLSRRLANRTTIHPFFDRAMRHSIAQFLSSNI
ncbi:hypothetical protein BKA93DRAFT_439675 [Sparassis latifolia]